MSRDSRGNKNRIYQIMALLFGIIFLCCIIWLISYFIGLKKAEKEMENIKDSFVIENVDKSSETVKESESVSEEPSVQESEVVESSEEVEPEPTIEQVDLNDYDGANKIVDIPKLQAEVNQHIYSWITVPGTVIDYPVLQHPTETDHYLDYNLNGSKGYPGCIYTQNLNSKDWSDPNTVLYGHNMKNGTMFAALHKYKSKSFFDDNPYIYIYTEDGKTLIYQIFAAYEYSDAHLLMNFVMYTESGRQAYFDSIRENEGMNSNFNNDIELTADSKIITLSTCISNKPNNRYLVQGVLIAEGAQ